MSEVEYRAELAWALAGIIPCREVVSMSNCAEVIVPELDKIIGRLEQALGLAATLAQKPVDAGEDGE